MRKKEQKTGIILAAGFGSRLFNSTGHEIIKPLTNVNDTPLILRVLHSHEIAYCSRTIIILGYKADIIEKYIRSNYIGPLQLEFIYNPKYHLQNGVSLLYAQPYINNKFLLTMADHILDDNIMKLLRDYHPAPEGATLCVDYKIDDVFDIDDATKVMAKGQSIKRIGKNLNEYNCIDTGVFIGTNGLMTAIAEIYKQKGNVSISEGVQLLADSGKMEALDIGEAFWQDVDTPEMLAHAEKMLSPNKKR